MSRRELQDVMAGSIGQLTLRTAVADLNACLANMIIVEMADERETMASEKSRSRLLVWCYANQG